jgi:putative ABC transport system permease protein
MSELALPPGAAFRVPPSLRIALRELQGGLRGFYVFIACIALGVMTIASVGSFARGLTEGLAHEGRIILGGDLSFSLVQRDATPPERAFVASRGAMTVTATLRAMARSTEGKPSRSAEEKSPPVAGQETAARATRSTALVEIKAIDDAYPLYGSLVTEPADTLASLLAKQGNVFGAVVDPAMLARLNLGLGSRFGIGAAQFEIRAILTSEPDKIAGGIAFGPRLLISQEALRATDLLQPGSLVRWTYRVRLPDGGSTDAAVQAAIDSGRKEFPSAGWEIRTRSNVAPQLERSIEQFTQYLTLVGLTALLVGGVGIANSVKYYLDRKRDVIATLKSMGATGTRIFVIYFTEILLLALGGSIVGLLAGAALPFAVAGAFVAVVPLPFVPAIFPSQLALALAYGMLTAIAFALWPLGRAHDVPVSALFRGEVAPGRGMPRRRYVAATLGAIVALAAFAVAAAYDRRIALIFIVAAAAAFLLLHVVAKALMLIARRAPRARSTIVRLAVANIYRPGALTPTVVLSLGLGLGLLVTVLEIDGNLRRQFVAALPSRAPSFYFVDIQSSDVDRFDAFVHQRAPAATLERVPMLRGRIVAARGVAAEDLKPRPDVAWVLQSDRGFTYTDQVPAGSRVVAGKWWPPDYGGPPLVSFDKRIAEGLGLKLGDDITVNVLGRDVTARISNLRNLDWQSLGINFIMVFSPATFRGAPAMHLATLTYPDGGTTVDESAMLEAAADAFPAITVVRVKDAIEAVGGLVGKLVMGVRGASVVTLLAAALVLGGALAAGHRHRVYDAVILKTLGATRRQLIAAYALEYLLLGLATAMFGVAVGSIGAWRVVTDIMTLRYEWLAAPAAAAALGALAVTLLCGLVGTFTALGRKPAPLLRNL